MHPEQPGPLFREDVSVGGVELRLARLENKLDRLIALLEEGPRERGGGGIFEGIFDNIKYPITYFYDSVAAMRSQTPESGAFTRL